jgi:hypothetical protein
VPPSGFSQQAVRGALEFVRSCYEDLLRDVQSGKFDTYEEAIRYELDQLEKALTHVHITKSGRLVRRRKR